MSVFYASCLAILGEQITSKLRGQRTQRPDPTHKARFPLLVLVVLAGSTILTPVYAQSWPATKYPFLPKIIMGKDKPLCQLLRDKAVRQFLSSMTIFDLGADDDKGKSLLRWVSWQKVSPPFKTQATDILYRAELDLDGDGKSEMVLYRANTWSWRGPTYSAFVFPSTAAYYSALSKSESMESLLSQGASYYGGGASDIGAWQWNNLFLFRGKYYFLDQTNDYFRLIDSDITVYRLHANGRSEPVCTIQVLPDEQERNVFLSYPGIESYLKVLWNIGHGGPDCGTLHSGTRHDQEVRAAILRAGVRPWATSRSSTGSNTIYYAYGTVMEEFIRDWGYTDPWSQREYQTFLEHRITARRAIQKYLAEHFGLKSADAAKFGQKVLEDLTAAFFLVPSSYPQYFRPPDLDRILLALEGGTAAEVSQNILPFAIDNPKLLRALIKQGADVNHSNGFGKTLLMYAAHLNRPDSVKLLLDHGADVNAVTQVGANWFYCTRPQRLGRSALTYAAENASIEVMALLVEAGADTKILDSQGNDLNWYLSKNPRLTPAQKELSVDDLVRKYKSSKKLAGPSFSCAQAKTRVEKAICKNDLLTLQDRELSYAYKNWLDIFVDKESAKSEQRDWIERRSRTCGQRQTEYGFTLCLQQLTRARTRYLFNRLDESK